jgi:hypothetical protein
MASIDGSMVKRVAAACVIVPGMAMLLAACETVPQHSRVWLSYTAATDGCYTMADCPALTDEQWASGYYKYIGAEDENGNPNFNFAQWKELFGYWQSTPVRAVYGNRLDLQFGRDMNCWQQAGTERIACYVTNYGRAPFIDGRESGWPDMFNGINQAGDGDMHLSLATVAMVWDPEHMGRVGGPISYYAFGPTGPDGNQPLIRSVALDGEGPKIVPGMCRSCHGGGERQIDLDRDSFLPFDVHSFSFSRGRVLDERGDVLEPSPYTLDNQQEAFRQLNALVLKTRPNYAIENLINGWYGGNVETPGATVPDDSYIPPGWDVDPLSRNVYRNVYRKYCRMCHVAQAWPLAFENASDFDVKAVHRVVCRDRSMPNAQVPYGDRFKEGGSAGVSRFGQTQGFWVDEVAKHDLSAFLIANGSARCE